MSVYALAFLLTALSVAAMSLIARHDRGAVWTIVIVANMALSNLYRLGGNPFPDAFMAGLDLAVIAAIYWGARHRWELWLWIIMQISAFVSILHLATYLIAPGWIDGEIYLLLLELCNYAAVILIGGVGGYIYVGRRSGAAFGAWPRVLSFGPTVRSSLDEDRR
jgi:hypothetical protein